MSGFIYLHVISRPFSYSESHFLLWFSAVCHVFLPGISHKLTIDERIEAPQGTVKSGVHCNLKV